MKKTVSNKNILEKAVIAAKDMEIKELKKKLAEARKIAKLADVQYHSLLFAFHANAYSHGAAMRIAEHLYERSRKLDAHGKDIGPWKGYNSPRPDGD